MIMVTGGTGLVGNNVVRLLADQGERPRVLIRASSDPRPLEGLDVETVLGDLCDVACLRRACQGVHVVIHCAAKVELSRFGAREQWRVNVEGTENVAKIAKRHAARLVHVSSLDALGLAPRSAPGDETSRPTHRAPCPYVTTKREAERRVLEHVADGLDGLIVNPGFVLGPWDWKPSSGRMLLKVARGHAWLAPRGINTFCDARHVAAGIVATVGRGRTGARYVLGGECFNYREAWTILAKVTGGRAPLVQVGPVAPYIAGRCGDLFTLLTGRSADVNSASVAMARQSKCFLSTRAEAELGYHPGTLRAAAECAWSWFQEYGQHVGHRKASGR